MDIAGVQRRVFTTNADLGGRSIGLQEMSQERLHSGETLCRFDDERRHNQQRSASKGSSRSTLHTGFF